MQWVGDDARIGQGAAASGQGAHVDAPLREDGADIARDGLPGGVGEDGGAG